MITNATDSGNDVEAGYAQTRQPMSTTSRRFLWVFSILMIVTAGTAFIFKLIEFFISLGDPANTVAGGEGLRSGFIFAVSPLITYLLVASGFACLFVWSYLKGHYRDVEAAKYRMLELQGEIDRAEGRG